MCTIHCSAQSGLEAASTRVNVSAHNVANALTPGYLPGRVDAAEQPGGGVTTAVSRPADPLAEARADAALLAASGTDLVAEVVAQAEAARLFEANAATLRTADALFEAALRLKT
ncbi:MAG: flagellar basal body protein [Anaeromyxobacteraceae bacterium]|nr:flagellar basal body protein [Anaeromyxobacteraceae bacterium]